MTVQPKNGHTHDGVFGDFPKISDHFPKLFRRPDERSRTFSENFRRLPKTFEEDPKMFRSYTNELNYNCALIMQSKSTFLEIFDVYSSLQIWPPKIFFRREIIQGE